MEKKQIFGIVIFVFLLIAIPVTMYLVKQQQILKSKAAFTPSIEFRAEFVDDNGNVITETHTPNVKLRIAYRTLVSSSPSLIPSSAPSLAPTPVTSSSPTQSPSSTFSPSPVSTPLPSLATFDMNVLVIKYFPLDNGQNIDQAVTGDIGASYAEIRQHTIDVTNNLKEALEKASKYLGYIYSNSPSSLNYHILDTKEYTQAVPIKPRPDSPRYPDYYGIMNTQNICNYVDNFGVKEVWLWAYQGPNKSDGQPYLAISESKMSGPYGDISNSYRYNDMPMCRNTYRVYTFNYGRGTAEAMESWGHQFESELDAVDRVLFRDKFQGQNYPQTLGVTGRCGSVHNPPNARYEYDRGNETAQNSDCLDWNPDNLGKVSAISCENWSLGCRDNGDNDNPTLNYMIWNWQNLPGLNNNKTYQGQKLRNLWEIHGDFDNVMKSFAKMTL